MSVAPVIHLVSGLAVGGKERAALRLARRGQQAQEHHELWLFDTPFRSADLDFDPGSIPCRFLPRGPGLDLHFVRDLAHAVAASGARAIHAYNDTALCYAALARLWTSRRRFPRLVATFHAWPSHPTLASRLITRWASYSCDATVAVSGELADRLVKNGWLRRCGTVRNGIDPELFARTGDHDEWRRRLGMAPDAPLIVQLARLDPIKRHVDVIEAARLVRDAFPEAVFVLAGSGPQLEPLKALARDIPSVRFVGLVSEVAPLLRATSVFVLPSAHEGAPLALLEAMACGCACVCTQVGGMPAMLADDAGEPCGLLVPPGEPVALAFAITKLLADKGLRAIMGARAREAAGRFSFDEEWRTYRGLYAGGTVP